MKNNLSPDDQEYLRKQIKKLIISACVLVVLVAAYFILNAIVNK